LAQFFCWARGGENDKGKYCQVNFTGRCTDSGATTRDSQRKLHEQGTKDKEAMHDEQLTKQAG
jgi:hypothetical protein